MVEAWQTSESEKQQNRGDEFNKKYKTILGNMPKLLSHRFLTMNKRNIILL